ncbi:MAG: ribose-5-phosphate isomerase RpiA [Paracoccus sp. (in: a-proteobacteria)]|uniref:ribose-5-phosphate isomerase RpiA n=1 Tax=Paracoccus sp. TaxID=267 RepID=UPI0026DF31AE|nr:ribose-5-phosphate isomerase RpiA [Paracoccus sp. (in: a-proteobacteria)]MDO5622325.1 ribose-5-phosphate isomerase RpiA [Paracoccus sp. (in: a-proteobacteria)]
MTGLSPQDMAKDAAARAAAGLVQDGMRLGLGTGSTAAWLVRRLAERVEAEGLTLRLASTSEATAKQARDLGMQVEELDQIGWLDLTIDGADEIDPDLNLIKGGGGALLREKIVASASDQMVVIADQSKLVDRLGLFHLPVEVIPFGWETTQTLIRNILEHQDMLQRPVILRKRDGLPFQTDEGNLILDLALEEIHDPARLAQALNALPGVVENGLFLGLCKRAIIGHEDGSVSELMAEDAA